MYTIKRKNARVPTTLRNLIFKNYEVARRAIRNYLRSRGLVTGNAAISSFGFSVARVTN